MTVGPVLPFGREVGYWTYGTNWGPTGVVGGDGALLANLGVVTFRPVRHWVEGCFVVQCDNAGVVLYLMLYDQTAGTPGTPLGGAAFLQAFPQVVNRPFMVQGRATFIPPPGQRNLALRWASNGGTWTVQNASWFNGNLTIREAPVAQAVS